jgi:hypothetical protein
MLNFCTTYLLYLVILFPFLSKALDYYCVRYKAVKSVVLLRLTKA